MKKKELKHEKNIVAIGADAELKRAKNTRLTKAYKTEILTRGNPATRARRMFKKCLIRDGIKAKGIVPKANSQIL